MRRSVSLVSAAVLCIAAAAAAIGGRVSADPPQVVVHNGDPEEVIVTITDLNTPNGLIIANQQGLNPSADLPLNATLDSHGDYSLHWKAQDSGRTKTEEGDCQATPVFACRIDLFTAP
jgi:hypothetical protein